jgi:anti-anti-sigma regulatory factor
MAEADLVEIDCGDAMGIADVSEFYANALNAIAEGHPLSVNISELERVDAAALQMLYAMVKEFSQHGAELTISSPSEAFIRAARLLGVAERFDIEHNSNNAVE